jgi:hypothetical protein
MRAFFVTAAMFEGKDALWITDRSGHTTLGMLRRYERDVRRWRELGESPVDAAAAIPEFVAAFAAANAAAEMKSAAAADAATRVTTEKCTGRESNPKKQYFSTWRCCSFFVVRVRFPSAFCVKTSPRESHGVLTSRPSSWRDFGDSRGRCAATEGSRMWREAGSHSDGDTPRAA